MLRNLKNNNHGIVFVTVLMIIIVMMVLAINVISMNVTQVRLTEGEVKRLQQKLLAEGALAAFVASQQNGTTNSMNYNVTLDNINYTINASISGNGTGLYETSNLEINVSN